jgi:hypothetical protein
MPETFSNITFEAVHVPERHDPAPHDKDTALIDLPGTVDLFVVIDGGRLLLDTFKAPKVFAAIEASKRTDDTAKPPATRKTV